MGVFSATTDGRALRKGHASRSLREDHDLPTPLDELFSNWKVLVGPDDWQNHYSGREGAAKYRLHNLPSTNCFHSGVYELAIYLDKSIHVHGTRKGTSSCLRKDALVPVYVGQAENLRDRLQEYGRNGSHLEGLLQDGKCQQCETSFLAVSQTKLGFLERIVVPSNQELCSSPHLFTSTFIQGYFIAFRWKATKSKVHAAALEAHLLQSYDYAWNRGSNGKRRPEGAFEKLQHVSKARSWHKWINKLCKMGSSKVPNLCEKRAVINFDMENLWRLLDNPATRTRVSVPDENTEPTFELSISWRRNVTEEKISPSSQLIYSKKRDVHGRSETIVCGIMDDSGNSCKSLPPPGRKRCEEHKGMRLRRARLSADNAILTWKNFVSGPSKTNVCRVIDGRDIAGKPPLIRERYVVVQACKDRGAKNLEGSLVCGYILKDGSKCMALPKKGRKRCTSHKGRCIKKCSLLMVETGKKACEMT